MIRLRVIAIKSEIHILFINSLINEELAIKIGESRRVKDRASKGDFRENGHHLRESMDDSANPTEIEGQS